MKKYVFFISLALIISGVASAQVARGGTLYVSIRDMELKASTGWFARTTGTLSYGDQVTVIEVSGRFVNVRSMYNQSITGWTASANFSTRQVVSGTTSTATAREVALAGKGFNAEVESSYRSQHSSLNYDAVDRAEAIKVNDDELRRFLEEGRLSMGDN